VAVEHTEAPAAQCKSGRAVVLVVAQVAEQQRLPLARIVNESALVLERLVQLIPAVCRFFAAGEPDY